jgi:hypothetical protein
LLILVLFDSASKKFRNGLRRYIFPDVANVELIEDELNDKLYSEENKKDADEKVGHRAGCSQSSHALRVL